MDGGPHRRWRTSHRADNSAHTLSKMASATASLVRRATVATEPSAPKMVTSLVSWSNPDPGGRHVVGHHQVDPLGRQLGHGPLGHLVRLGREPDQDLPVRGAVGPARPGCPGWARGPGRARRRPCAAWIVGGHLGTEVGHRRGHDDHVGAGPAWPSTDASMSAAVSTRSTATPSATGWALVVTSTTSAPRRRAAAARAWPCFPEDRLVMNRTGSIGSRVPPADTTTRTPARSPVRPARRLPSGRRTGHAAAGRARCPTITDGSASRPAPMSPPASRPSSGGTTVTPRERRTARLCWTAGCSHISVCMAGQTTTGAAVAIRVAVSRSSAKPPA